METSPGISEGDVSTGGRRSTDHKTSAEAGTFIDPAPEFHAHLDACRQCREHPFALCVEGQRIILEAAANLSQEIETK